MFCNGELCSLFFKSHLFSALLQLSRYPLLKSKKILEKEVNLFTTKKKGSDSKKELVQCV